MSASVPVSVTLNYTMTNLNMSQEPSRLRRQYYSGDELNKKFIHDRAPLRQLYMAAAEADVNEQKYLEAV